ncbi:MAG: magnesium/cobalt transporter CorA [Dysgonomonas sp.]
MLLRKYDIPTTVELIRYNSQQFVTKTIAPNQKMQDEISPDAVSWFKVTGFTDINRIGNLCKTFGIHRFDIKDLFSNLQVTKIVTYEKATFIMMSGCFYDDQMQLEVEQIAFILGENYVISLQEAPNPFFDDIIEAIKDSRAQLREKGADYLLYILLNDVHSLYIDVIDKISEKLDDVEDKLIDDQSTDKRIMHFFRARRRDYALMRRSIMPIREEYVNLMHNSNKLILDDSMVYFNDFDDRLRTTLEELEALNETIASLMQLYFSNSNMKMNDIMRRLTIVSTIFIPLTFVVGVWGMNFKYMPELEWKYGYVFSWIIMIIIVIVAIYLLKKKRWF